MSFIIVYTGTAFGKSRRAAIEGLAMCCSARVVWNIPILGLTPVLMAAYAKTKFSLRNPRFNLPVNALLGTACICAGIYPAQALYTQTAAIPAERLEAEFQGLTDKKGDPITEFYYNKGL